MTKWAYSSKRKLVQHSKINVIHHMKKLKKKKSDNLNRCRKTFDIIQQSIHD